ncbi:MAG: hypothetical protein Q7U75_02340, partial [Desulfobacterales bacterium]|nr:hypothetical protein [Desulfobacterales bacterium]
MVTPVPAIKPLLQAFYGHAMCAPPVRFNRFEFQAMSHKYGQMAVALHMNGQRFADESAGTGEELPNSRIALQPGCRAVYVFDAVVGERALEGSPLARVVADRARQAGALVLQTNSLEDLARQLDEWGLPPAVALRAMQAYNEAMASQDRQALLPPRHTH